ncbi:MAG TPA: glycosyltransferase [Marmoricola sp.]|nr:glycosyltransferase [Marmoricola sp.]
MTIALVTSSMDGGGAQRAVAKLASGLAAAGHDVDLVLAHARGPYLAELPPSVRVVDLGATRLATAVLPLVRYLRRARPTAVLSALDYVNVVAVLARGLSRTHVPLVVSERNTLSAAVAHTRNRTTRWMPRLLRLAYPHADAVVAVSRGVADDLESLCGLPAGSVRVLDNPVVTPELQRMRAQPVEHPWLRDQPDEREVPVVLAVGRLVPQKDFATLLDAVAVLRRRRPVRLVVLGDGPLRGELEKRCADLGLTADVSLPGFCANPYPAMAAADVFVLSSRFEGSPGALIEAMSCGTPVVATDCPSGPRELLDGGRHGRLVPVGDSVALADALGDALDGRVPPPPPQSWRRYEQTAVVASCLALLEEVAR